MEGKYVLTEEKIERITGLIENAIGSAVRSAITEVVGHESKRKPRGRPATPEKDAALEQRILDVLASAPAMAKESPELKGYLAQRSMPKTMLRRHVGNSYENFDAVLEKLVAEKRILTGKDKGPRGRYIILFGLP